MMINLRNTSKKPEIIIRLSWKKVNSKTSNCITTTSTISQYQKLRTTNSKSEYWVVVKKSHIKSNFQANKFLIKLRTKHLSLSLKFVYHHQYVSVVRKMNTTKTSKSVSILERLGSLTLAGLLSQSTDILFARR